MLINGSLITRRAQSCWDGAADFWWLSGPRGLPRNQHTAPAPGSQTCRGHTRGQTRCALSTTAHCSVASFSVEKIAELQAKFKISIAKNADMKRLSGAFVPTYKFLNIPRRTSKIRKKTATQDQQSFCAYMFTSWDPWQSGDYTVRLLRPSTASSRRPCGRSWCLGAGQRKPRTSTDASNSAFALYPP